MNRFQIGGRLITVALCLFVGLVSLTGLFRHSAAALSHRAVPGVVTACHDPGERSATCTVQYVLDGARDTRVDATGTAVPRPGEQVHLWVSDGRVYLAGDAFLHDVLLMTGVLAACLLVVAGLLIAVRRAGERREAWAAL